MWEQIRTGISEFAAVAKAAPGMIWTAAHTPAFYFGLGIGMIFVTAIWQLSGFSKPHECSGSRLYPLATSTPGIAYPPESRTVTPPQP